jgi:beta-N-acetylhexosaminidase
MAGRRQHPTMGRRAFVRAGGATLAGLGIAGAAPAGRAAGGPSSRRNGWIRSAITRMTTEQKIGQLLISYVYGSNADTADARNTERYGVATPAEVVRKYALGGVIYFSWSGNTADPEQIAGLSDGLQRATRGDRSPGRADVPLLISADQ